MADAGSTAASEKHSRAICSRPSETMEGAIAAFPHRSIRADLDLSEISYLLIASLTMLTR